MSIFREDLVEEEVDYAKTATTGIGIAIDEDQDPVDTPEKALIVAILTDAIRTYFGDRSRPEWVDAQEWIMRDQGEHPFSFENTCYFVGIDPDALRKGITGWQGQQEGEAQ